MSEIFDLSKFNEYREGNRLEVKRASDNLPNEIWPTYSAFANTAGGCIILGVKEKADKTWVTTGLKNVRKLRKDFFDNLHNKNKVNVALVRDEDVAEYKINGHEILVIKVPKADREIKPVYIRNDIWNETYRRDGEGDYRCSREAVLEMLRDQTERSPDMKILENKEISALNHESIRSYRIRYNYSHDGHPWTKKSDEEFLVQIGAASDETSDHRIHPTAAGLLMFGTYPVIMREFPNFFLDYYEKIDPTLRWTDRVAAHDGEWSGNLYDFYSTVYPKLASILKKPFRLNGIYRIDDTPVHVAVREAMANCIANADYFLPECVKIEKFSDRIVLTNPGSIIIGKKQMLRGGKSRPRNKVILNMLNYIGIGERAGSGVPSIYTTWEQEGFDAPTVEELSGRDGVIATVVTLPLVPKSQNQGSENAETSGNIGDEVFSGKNSVRPDDLLGRPERPEKRPERPKISSEYTQNSSEHSENSNTNNLEDMGNRCAAILQELKENPKISRPMLMEKLNLTERQVKTAIEHIKKSGKARYSGARRGGSWIVNE
ncbi:MAG: putative DNA binding domain-containing protein [Succinivibrionaceae bacterium]|nr:putative DNA binding domain-containing protein [Succinivibrionaceae bacterium]